MATYSGRLEGVPPLMRLARRALQWLMGHGDHRPIRHHVHRQELAARWDPSSTMCSVLPTTLWLPVSSCTSPKVVSARSSSTIRLIAVAGLRRSRLLLRKLDCDGHERTHGSWRQLVKPNNFG